MTMARPSKADRAVKAWQDATGCTSPREAAEKIQRTEGFLEREHAHMGTALRSLIATQEWLGAIGAALGCAPTFPAILAATQAKRAA